MIKTEQSWGVFYDHPYKRELMQECKTFDEACEERMNWSFNNEGDPNYFVDEVKEEDLESKVVSTESAKNDITLLNGQMNFPNLKAPTGKEYEVLRAQLWICMINDGKRPTKWLKATKKGTKVNFDFINSSESNEQAFKEVESHIANVNDIYGLKMTLRKMTTNKVG